MVTLLFADLAGYTALCESRDPEQVHLLIRPLMNALRACCEERGGLVPSIEGDGFMAVFGARLSHEDDPARALDAAVQLQRAVRARRLVLPELPTLRVGLHVGEVVVASSWEPTGLSLSGDAVNVASRVCGQAVEGEVLVTREAEVLTRVGDGWGEERELVLRGRTASVVARSFDWTRTDVGRGSRWSASSRYVPRPKLEESLRQAIEGPPGALVVGDAGMGKSRLVGHVLRHHRVMAASCSTAFRASACGLAADVLDQLEESPPDLLRLLRGGASGGLADEGLLLRAVAMRLTSAAPDATIFIDDAELLAMDEVQLLAGLIASCSLTWVVASRSFLPCIDLVSVEVPAWSPQEAAQLLEGSLPGASAELREAVLTRAGDCPLYVEQCAQLLLDNGAVEVGPQGTRVVAQDRLSEIPSSMRLFVSSRIDLLPLRHRDALGVAAVLGAEPDLALLEFVIGEDSTLVEELVEHGFLRWVRGPAGQPGLRFAHALVRDVSYETQLRSRRVAIHKAAAEWYTVLPVSQVLESQAYHLEQATRLEEPDCDLVRRTIDAMVLFARSIEEERTRTSREVLDRARALATRREECGPDLLSLELATSSVSQLSGDVVRAADAAELARGLAEARGDQKGLAESYLLLARSARFHDEVRALESLDRAASHYERAQDRAGVARVELERAILFEHREGLVPFVRQLEVAFVQAMRSADTRLQALCAQWLAMHHAFVFGRQGFLHWAQQAREVSRSDDVGLEPRLDVAAAGLSMLDVDPTSGLEPARRALNSGRELGLEHVYSNALIANADLLLLAGLADETGSVLREAREFAIGRPTPWYSLQFNLIEARLHLRGGQPFEALRRLDEVAAHDLAEQKVLRRDLSEARAWVALERGHFGEARALAVETVGVDDELGERCPPMRPRLIEVIATVAAGETVALGTIAALRTQARETGLATIAQLATRWLYVDELTRGWTVDLHGVSPCNVIECRALDLEIEALSSRRWELFLAAAAVWAELGTTVWHARALLWHSELTGTPSPEADELLTTLQSPDGLAELLRSQVRGLRA